MKLSNELINSIPATYLWKNGKELNDIVFMVDCKETEKANTLEKVDTIHNKLIENGCKLLPKECPVISSDGNIYLHYTSTTYKNWCNL